MYIIYLQIIEQTLEDLKKREAYAIELNNVTITM